MKFQSKKECLDFILKYGYDCVPYYDPRHRCWTPVNSDLVDFIDPDFDDLLASGALTVEV